MSFILLQTLKRTTSMVQRRYFPNLTSILSIFSLIVIYIERERPLNDFYKHSQNENSSQLRMFQLSQTLLKLKLRQNCLSNITTHYDNAMNIWEYFEKIILHKNILVPNDLSMTDCSCSVLLHLPKTKCICHKSIGAPRVSKQCHCISDILMIWGR